MRDVSYPTKGTRGAKSVLTDKRYRQRGAKHYETQTVYIKISLPVVDFVYGLYPDKTLAGGIEAYLLDGAWKSINEPR